MSYAVDPDFVVDVKEPARPPVRIGLGFNLALFAFVSLLGFLRFVSASSLAARTPWAGLVLTSLIDMARVLVVLLITAAFLQRFWGRLVATIWPVRVIDFAEAFAVVMMLSLLFGT
ncbi:hypothetical protein [Paludisphaera rhizosphaerae]|uniref:hypothetical protein n=1 Tax=Paludisphaera rhizosphaerae TaxID=2711216 RepID=UPI0013EB429A|nr:hypothetical protein [Paludisphaera rhizosphaerae]